MKLSILEDLRSDIDSIKPYTGEIQNLTHANDEVTYTYDAIEDIKSTLRKITDALEEIAAKLPE